MLNGFKYGFSAGAKQWRIAALVYCFQFCLAVTVGLQVLAVFESSIGNSLEINKLLQHYDFTVISDFLKTHGASITPLIGQLRWLFLLYLIFAIFIDGGLLTVASNTNETAEQSPFKTFWIGGATYFFSFLKIGIFFLLLAAVWTVVIFFPVALFLEPSLEFFPNEKYSIYGLAFLFVIYLIGLSFLLLWSVASRFWKIKTEVTIAICLKKGWQFFRKNSGRIWRLLGSFFAIQLALAFLYWAIDVVFGMTSVATLVFMVVIQQLFSFFRVMLRQMFYTGYAGIFSAEYLS